MSAPIIITIIVTIDSPVKYRRDAIHVKKGFSCAVYVQPIEQWYFQKINDKKRNENNMKIAPRS